MNKHKKVILGLSLVLSLVCFATPALAFLDDKDTTPVPLPGQESATKTGLTYQLLEKLPGTDGLNGSDLKGYVKAIYNVALIVVTLSAVLMLSVGGFMYLTSGGNTSSLSSAKSIIYDSLIGLVIALSAWLVLNVINPDLVGGNIESTFTPIPPSTSGTIGTPPTGSDQELAALILKNESGKIGLAGDGSCSTSGSTPVTPVSNLESIAAGKRADKCFSGCNRGTISCETEGTGLSNKMLAAILAVGQNQRFTITSIAGGAHSNTSKHYTGNAIDIVPVTQSLMTAFVNAGAFPPQPNGGKGSSMCEDKNGNNVDCTTGGGTHIHLVFP